MCIRDRGDPFEFRNQTWQAKSSCLGLHFNENCVILVSAVWSVYTYYGRCSCKLTFKVIDFCYIRKPTYDFLLVINCRLSSILHHFWDIALRIQKPPHPTLTTRSRASLRILSSNLAGKDKGIGLHFSENCMIIASAVLSQYTHITDRWQADRWYTTYYDNSQTLRWNCSFRF